MLSLRPFPMTSQDGVHHAIVRFLAPLILVFSSLGLQGVHASSMVTHHHDPDAEPQAAYELAWRVLETGDHAGLPFVIVHKRAGLALVYHGDGRLAGASRVLLGLTVGDLATAGVGERTSKGTLRRADLTTPAGRFESEPGRNLRGEPVVWIDYESALAIHRLRPGASRTQRALQLASSKVGNKRASAGCVVVPENFYDHVIGPVLGRGRGIVYVMPEQSSWRDKWSGLGLSAAR